MFNLDEEKVSCALGYMDFFWQAKKAVFVSDVGICGYYLSLTLGTPEFKQLDLSCSFHRYQLR